MGKSKLITIAICLVFIVFSGVFYIKTGSGIKTSFVNDTEKDCTSDNTKLQITESINTDNIDNTNVESIETIDEIVVYICGAVKLPGVYNFTVGQRLCDAIKAAGGFKKSAAISAINLARKLNDGEQIIIPTKKQVAKEKNITNLQYENTGQKIDTSSLKDGLVNINTASKEELMTLSGIGESKADAIIEYRLSNNFKSIEDIKNVSGIKDGVFNQIKDQITV